MAQAARKKEKEKDSLQQKSYEHAGVMHMISVT
jgi:hypothetical protein